jgi:ankyrin repeat protein
LNTTLPFDQPHRELAMEEPDTPRDGDHETVAREWSQEEIYESLTPPNWADDGPFIAASGLEDSSTLLRLLKRAQLLQDREQQLQVLNQALDPWLGDINKWPSPLLRAIERQRPENVRLLLQHGADPNGLHIDTQRHLARLYRRFWSSESGGKMYSYNQVLSDGGFVYAQDVGNVSAENVPFTEAELTTRRSRVARFWTEPHKTGLSYSLEHQLLHPVIRAGTSTPDILDQLLASSADASLWLGPDVRDILPDEEELSSSALALSTPLHAAIASNNITMLRALLNRGFNPNSRALITGSLALTPAQYAITIGNFEAYAVLDTHDRLGRDILTPVFHVHSLHFAAALLRKDLMQATKIALSSVAPTKLGHTLLHVACLPHSLTEVQTSEKVEQSVHDIWSLRETSGILRRRENIQYDSEGYQIRPETQHDESGRAIFASTDRDIPDEFHRQEEVCKLIISELGAEQIGLVDVHGNTALHYLAGAWYLNENLITWMRAQTNGEFMWQKAENRWGHTPQALWDDNWSERSKPPADFASRSRGLGWRGWRGRGHSRGGWEHVMRGRNIR